jgi:hypothetical protein
MAQGSIPEVDHFQRVLTHFNDERLLATTRDYLWHAYEGPWCTRSSYVDHAERCRAECKRRGLMVPDTTIVEKQ